MGQCIFSPVTAMNIPPEPTEQTPTRELFPWEQPQQLSSAVAPANSWYQKNLLSQSNVPWKPVLIGCGVGVLCSALVLAFSSSPVLSPTSAPVIADSPTATRPDPRISSSTDNSPPSRRPLRPRLNQAEQTAMTMPSAVVPAQIASVDATTEPTVTPSAPPVATVTGSTAAPASSTVPYRGVTKEDLKEILKNVGRQNPFSTPALAIAPPLEIKPLPLPPLPTPITPKPIIPLEPPPTLTALAYAPDLGWLAEVELNGQSYEASRGTKVGTWIVRSVGKNGIVVARGKETLTLYY